MSENASPVGAQTATIQIQSPMMNATLGTSFLVRGAFGVAKRNGPSYTILCQLTSSGGTTYDPNMLCVDFTSYNRVALFAGAPAGSNYQVQATISSAGRQLDQATVTGLTLDASKAVVISSPSSGSTVQQPFNAQGTCPTGLTAAGHLYNGGQLKQDGINTNSGNRWTSEFGGLQAVGGYTLVVEALQDILSVCAAWVTNLTLQ
jgi:hypothetical protein